MGIQGLSKLLSDNAPACVREKEFESFFGRKIAVDASMQIYQSMIVVGRVGNDTLTNEAGDVTSHLQGMLNRTTRMLKAGMKPVYVFDGKPPELKSHELGKRTEKRTENETALKEAVEAGNQEEMEKFSKRSVKVTREHNEEVKKLLRLMGMPVIEAPSEAEAQCAVLCAADKVYAVSTEDMDVLTFGTKKVARNLMVPAAAKKPILEFDLDKVLEGLELTMDQFIDLCILCGCDYCPSIKGIGPVSALKLIKKHTNIEGVLENLSDKYQVPADWNYKGARELFVKPDVTAADQIPEFKWTNPDEEGLIQFLVEEKSFNEDRVRSSIKAILASKQKSSQGRLESFFGATTTHSSTLKRKAPEVKGKGAKGAGALAKKGKGVGGRKK
eukprot:CAMPEP_0118923684 /NCGR_PEP_ID=MMETSP1169-20130426/2117_1 /TAXON_ID=36882 /ORGANISM="Pyramimonas obovata, Strain CCMP722" /LENGTH=385 /DNA_ID=CAMNT_0006864701 /DNA_START=65 /DNA_END=1222 /DNA_ORIENTATION=+